VIVNGLLVSDDSQLHQEVDVKSYNFRQFVLVYGPAKCYTVCLSTSVIITFCRVLKTIT